MATEIQSGSWDHTTHQWIASSVGGTHLNISSWLKRESGCGTFKGGERDSKVGQSKNIFNNYSWYPAYLYHTSTLQKICIALQRWGDKMERERYSVCVCRGKTWQKEIWGKKKKKEQRQSEEWAPCLLILAWLVMKRGCTVQYTNYFVQCVPRKHFLWCSMLNFSNICSVVVSEPPTKHQHCTHHCKPLPRLTELNIYHTDPHLSHVTFSLFWDEGFGLEGGGKKSL